MLEIDADNMMERTHLSALYLPLQAMNPFFLDALLLEKVGRAILLSHEIL